LTEATPAMADMRTMVIIGSSATRIIATPRGPILYTPRSA
jgi:precorrin-3B C17-methyltransferase